MDEANDRVKDHYGSYRDGVRILFGDGWGLVRASNTQPALVARFEARTPKRLEAIKAEVFGKLREYPFVTVPADL